MSISIKRLFCETVKYCSVLLVAYIISSLIITKTSIDILIIFLVGWFIALLNFFLLAYSVSKMNSKNMIWINLPIMLLRYALYFLSMYYCVDDTLSGILWAGGVVSVTIGIVIAEIKTKPGKEENL